VNISTQVRGLARQIRDAHKSARSSGKVLSINIDALVMSLERIASDVNALELQSQQSLNGLSNEWLTDLIIRARWVLSSDATPAVTRELAEAVLILVNRSTPT
jgi:hypothetical protein